jgi:tRNA dimethylallyltransferase
VIRQDFPYHGEVDPAWSNAISSNLDTVALPPVVIIAGPTASGKSALALDLAERFDGTVINADALQLYRDLPILSAWPEAEAWARVPHRLYGWLDASERGSAGRWREAALREIAAAHRAGRLPVVVGGTGLYLRALRDGLVAIPPVPSEIRAEAATLYGQLGGELFRAELARLDPEAASRLPSGDRQRLTRAFEIVRATGTPIGAWQRRKPEQAPYRFASILLMPPREALYAACDARFLRMIEAGALGEAASLAARALAPDLPAMKGVGVPELLSHLRGEVPLGAAVALAQQATRRYAKRQMTWFRHQMAADLRLNEQYSESLLRCSCHFVDQFLLTGRG